MSTTVGQMTVEIRNGKAITGRGRLSEEIGGEVYFDYAGKPYPSSVDWKRATSLTFTPDVGKKTKQWFAANDMYYFQGGWVAPRLLIEQGGVRGAQR